MKRNYCAALNFIGLMAVLFFLSCSTNKNEKEEKIPAAEWKEKLIRANKQFVKNQLDDIQGYIERHGYIMDSTATGLKYKIKSSGIPDARPATVADIAGVRYKIKLLDGRECYTADSALYREYHLTNDDMPSGMREGILLMHEGDKALFIIPSHLAFGLTGDSDCIPPNAALVMTVTLEKLFRKN